MADLRDVSEKAGFSVSVVSRALNPNEQEYSRVSYKTRKQIRKVAEELGFSRNRSAEYLRYGRNAAIGVFLPKIPNRLIADQVIGMTQEANAHAFPLSFHFSLSEAEYRDFIQLTTRNSNSGIITYPPNLVKTEQKLLDSYMKQGGKVLMLNTLSENTAIPHICIDNSYGGMIAAEHLLTRDCRSFVSLGEFDGRADGFHMVLRENGKEGLFLDEGDTELASLLQSVRRNPEKFLPMGIFATKDRWAMKAMKIIRQHGLKIGHEVLLVGYDNLFLTESLDPPLTTVHQPFKEQGRMAVKMIVDSINGNPVESKKIKPSLIIRESA